MRLARSIAAITFTSLCVAPLAHAQETTLFQDSWFWGVHAGGTHLGTATGPSGSNGTVGAEWLITRTHAGLYIAYDQANFTRTASVADPSAASGSRPVTVNDMRTGSIALMAFPAQFGRFRPYAGFGFAISVLGNATPAVLPSDTVTISPMVQQQTTEASSRSAAFFIGGGQWQIHRTALYGQVTILPPVSSFLLDRTITNISLGVRYNFGSSIER